tara:strand:- start:151 stop:1551 length:1401 start_codon:yes stop_codon:yes gene_type:complete
MSKISLNAVPTGNTPGLSHDALALYLRLGFLPSPLSVLRHEAIVNEFDTALTEDFDPNRGTFLRDLRQYTGTRNRSKSDGFDEQSAIDGIRQTLLAATARVTEGYDHVYLMVSGGKDSLSVAWALKELGRKATLIHCTNRGREDESSDVARVCELLGYDCIYLTDDIIQVDTFLTSRAAKLPIPIADQAFFSYLRAVSEISGKLDEFGGRAILLDGMGNDAYMGHIPPKREKRLLSLPRLPFLSEAIITALYSNSTAHYALETLFKRRGERHFSGAGFAVDDGPVAPDAERIFSAYNNQPEERRALLRGGIYDIDCCIRKGVLAAALDNRLDIGFPFLDPAFITLYSEFPEGVMFDYKNSFNKRLLRKLLEQVGILSEFVSSHKGSFRFNLNRLPEVYEPSASLIETLDYMSVRAPAVSSIRRYANTSFVAAQKLGQLYVLDKFLGVHDVAPKPVKSTGINIRYHA